MKLMGALALLVLLVAISFEHVHAEATCETGWLPLPNTTDICYKKFEGLNLTYYGAEDHCAGLDAELPGPKYKNPIDYIDFDTRIWIYTPGIRNNNCKTLNIESDVNNNRAIMMRDCYNTYNFICIKLGEGVTRPPMMKAMVCDDPFVKGMDGNVLTEPGLGKYTMSLHPYPDAPCYFEISMTVELSNNPIFEHETYVSAMRVHIQDMIFDFAQTYLVIENGEPLIYADYLEGDELFHADRDVVYEEDDAIVLECPLCHFIFMWKPAGRETCAWLFISKDIYFGVGLVGLWGNGNGNEADDYMNAEGEDVRNSRYRNQEMSSRFRVVLP